MEQHYVLKLWEPAAPAFCSFSKPYIGDSKDLLRVARAMEIESPSSETAKAIREYFAGNHNATHNIAYQEIPVLEPVEVFESSELKLPETTWEHLNAWKWPYIMKFASAQIKQILIKYDSKYHRCIKAAITDLCYEGIRSTWVPVGSAYWGNASILKTKRLAGGQQIFGNILYVQEDSSEDKEVLSRRMNDPEAVILGRLCDEIFGDG